MSAASAPAASGPLQAEYMSDKTTWHPPGLFMLCTTEMWERMSYYGMRALLVLYMVDNTKGGFGWTKAEALSIYGTYTGLVYLTPFFGGLIADNFLGQRRAVTLGGILMMIGHFLMAVPGVTAFYTALGFLIVGNGFFKPNISTMIGGLYRPGDARRESAFTFFYMGINIGAFLAPLVCGTLGEKIGWHYGFGAAGVGMGIGLTVFLLTQRRFLGNVGLSPKDQASAGVPATEPFTTEHMHRLLVIFILGLFVIFFWAAFEQAGGLMNLYTDSKVDRVVGGFEVPTSWLQAVNPFFIVVFGPVLAAFWALLRKRSLEPTSAPKMAIGLLLLSFGFVLMMGASKDSDAHGKAALWWVVGAYFFHTIGELCLSPVGLSMVTKLAHARVVSAMMGVWFLANAIANKLSGVIGAYSETLGEYQLFVYIVVATAIAGIVLLALSMPLKWLTHGADEVRDQPADEKKSGVPAAA